MCPVLRRLLIFVRRDAHANLDGDLACWSCCEEGVADGAI